MSEKKIKNSSTPLMEQYLKIKADYPARKEKITMSYVPVQDYLPKTNSIYKLVIMASRRASELNNGAPKLVEADDQKVTTIALEEIAQDKVKMQQEKEVKKEK